MVDRVFDCVETGSYPKILVAMLSGNLNALPFEVVIDILRGNADLVVGLLTDDITLRRDRIDDLHAFAVRLPGKKFLGGICRHGNAVLIGSEQFSDLVFIFKKVFAFRPLVDEQDTGLSDNIGIVHGSKDLK